MSAKLTFSQMNDLAEKTITEFMGMYDIEDTDEDRAGIIWMLEELGVEIDACSHCGAMPMNTNCNNAGCDV